MAYVAVRGGHEAIEASIEMLDYLRLESVYSFEIEKILAGCSLLIDQVMSEASLYDREIAALAIKQAEGSPEEAVFIMRAFRSTVPRLYETPVIKTTHMKVERRISAAFKDIPGGQILGPSRDYTHRLLNYNLLEESEHSISHFLRTYQERYCQNEVSDSELPKVVDYLREQGLFHELPENHDEPKDITLESISFPTTRSQRLQVLTRGQTGAVTALGYASLRGFGGGALHPTVGELRVGTLDISIEENDESYYIGEILVTEVETFIPVTVEKPDGKKELEFEIGYGLCLGRNETKAIAMSLLDYNLEQPEGTFPTEDEEFVLLHVDSIEATGFISHLKLPHYVTFQSKMSSVRKIKEGNHEKT
jgi:alpha-D-ribose 1-methylphosphonate 5-triphosphate synthase subunit PhnI